MKFDDLISRLEETLLPVVQGDIDQLKESNIYSEVITDSIRHAEEVHALGIRCTPNWATHDFEGLSFFAAINDLDGMNGRFDIAWSQTFTPAKGTGYLKKEFSGFHSKLNTEDEISIFETKWREKNKFFMSIALKGRPSSRFLRWLRGSPRDLKGINKEVNQAVDTTAVSAPH